MMILNYIFICLHIIVVLLLVYEVFFNTQRDELRKKMCELYGHKNTIDVLATDTEGKLYVKCNKCERCLSYLPLDTPRAL